MCEQIRVEVPAQLIVQHMQYVLIELRSDASRVVVGSDQSLPILYQIRTEEERVVA